LASIGINIDEAQLLTSVIVRMELLSKRNMSNNEEKDILEFLDALTVIPLNETIENKAMDLTPSGVHKDKGQIQCKERKR
jgi:predicted nucleic acid-binding protein